MHIHSTIDKFKQYWMSLISWCSWGYFHILTVCSKQYHRLYVSAQRCSCKLLVVALLLVLIERMRTCTSNPYVLLALSHDCFSRFQPHPQYRLSRINPNPLRPPHHIISVHHPSPSLVRISTHAPIPPLTSPHTHAAHHSPSHAKEHGTDSEST